MNEKSGEQKEAPLKEFLDHVNEYNVEFAGVTLSNLNVRSLSGDCLVHVVVRGWDDWGGDVLRSLIENHVEINVAGDIGLTPLHVAAMNGNLEAVQILIQNGARKETTDENGSTALDKAHLHGHKPVADFLSEASP